jgi:hypothetical protein
MIVADLIWERIPHAPQLGLYVAPDVPDKKLRKAISDYATDVAPADVLALYDATLSGTAGDGALFTADRVVFQNNDLQSAQTVRYQDLVGVDAASRWWGLGGKRVDLTVNRGRATFDLSIDCSGTPDAAAYIADFLHAAMLKDVDLDADEAAEETDLEAVRRALNRLRSQNKLTDEDLERLLTVLASGDSSGSTRED